MSWNTVETESASAARSQVFPYGNNYLTLSQMDYRTN